jgi:hypothetical protein
MEFVDNEDYDDYEEEDPGYFYVEDGYDLAVGSPPFKY